MDETKVITKKERIITTGIRIAELEQDLAAIDAKDLLGVKRRAELVAVVGKYVSAAELGDLIAHLEQMDKDVLRAKGQDKYDVEMMAYSRKEQARRSEGTKNKVYGFINEVVAMVTQVRTRIMGERDVLLKELKKLKM